MLDIIIPCHNAAHTLPRAVQSCLNQPEAERIWLIDATAVSQQNPSVQAA